MFCLYGRRPAVPGCVGRRRGGHHRARRWRGCPRDGGAGGAACLRSFFAIPHGHRRKTCRANSRAGSRGDADRWARLFYFGRVGGHGNGAEAGAAILDRTRSEKTIPRDFPPAELSRQHAGRFVGFRKRPTARAVCAHAGGVGTHSSLLLLPVSVRASLSGMQRGVRG